MEASKRVIVSRAALVHNFELCRRQANGAGIIALVKADAYGHGMLECARLFADLGAAGLAVADAVEGVALREAGLAVPIYVLAGLAPQTVPGIVAHNLTPLVSDGAMLERLAHEAQRQKRVCTVHLKVDVGMGRQGALPEDFPELTRKALSLPAIQIGGMMAHLPKADDRNSDHSERARDAFARVSAVARGLVPYPLSCHLASSGALFYVADSRFDQVRPGIALYGCYPGGAAGKKSAGAPDLRPAMSWTADILLVRQVPAGHSIGYDCTWITKRPTKMAVLPLGYADGYLRRLSNRGQVLIAGRRAPVLGRVSMNLTVVDVTDIPGVDAGDEAVLLGRQGADEITADELAGWMETINYEALCLIGRLNRRVYQD